jgi:transcriptional regulator with XRE-family HTH domain
MLYAMPHSLYAVKVNVNTFGKISTLMAESSPPTESERLGKAIQLRRVELGLKRPELARRAQLSYPYVSEIENGMKTPSTRALWLLASALEMATVDLIALADRLGDSAGADAGSLLAEHLPTERPVLSSNMPPDAAGAPLEGGPTRALTARRLASNDVDDRKTQILIATVVRAELAAWARTELPNLVRAALEQALREQGK